MSKTSRFILIYILLTLLIVVLGYAHVLGFAASGSVFAVWGITSFFTAPIAMTITKEIIAAKAKPRAPTVAKPRMFAEMRTIFAEAEAIAKATS